MRSWRRLGLQRTQDRREISGGTRGHRSACADAPLRQIVDNAGFDGAFVVGKIREANDPAFGFDAAKGDYGDLVERGIIDPAKVVRVCIENACSVAAALVTTQVAVAEDDADKENAPDAA